MKIGQTYTVKTVVDESNTAAAVASGGVPVFGTPMMIALMESAALQLASQYLEEGQTTVGTRIEVSHTAATPIGMQVEATAKLEKIDGKLLTFSMTASDDAELIGEGMQVRAIVNERKFIDRTNSKLRPLCH